ncbi:uncharacterized protein LOC120076104 [Benincasa hispida]|uniref:uncharacterized protein LOC120076104 n=1 Tax=Benincasa hispida TaxID=102211 RepID=UPI001902A3C2|nr:uncharacterized protein LOC120076104 [Benincasa hispida]
MQAKVLRHITSLKSGAKPLRSLAPYLERASKRMKKWADKKRRALEFQAGDKVLIKLRPEKFRFRGQRDQRLVRKYEGPVEVIEKVGRTSYRVQLPSWMKIHPVIHVSILKPYHSDPEDEQRNMLRRPPVTMKSSAEKEVAQILDKRARRIGRPRRELTEFLVKWKDLPDEEIS